MASDAGADAPTDASGSRLRLTLDSVDAVPRLRDYLRRLGLEPAVHGSRALEVDGDGRDIEQALGHWTRVNGIPVQVGPLGPDTRAQPVPATALPRARIGELLVRRGFLTPEELESALAEAKRGNELLGVVLLRKKLIFEEELARILSEQLSIPYVSIMRCGVDPLVARLVPYEVGMQAAAIPVRSDGGTVRVAFADPTDPGALAAVKPHVPRIEVAVAELSDIRTALQTAFSVSR
jgi:hypothetical protein